VVMDAARWRPASLNRFFHHQRRGQGIGLGSARSTALSVTPWWCVITVNKAPRTRQARSQSHCLSHHR
jgi:hypothetical protein